MSSSRSLAVALIVIGVTAVIYFTHATSFPLAEPDEARHAEVGREMLETSDWVTPQLNYRPFLHKPPLLYWLTAACFRSFGVSEATARLPVMIAALGGLLVTFLLARTMYGPTTGAIATIILATSPLYFGMGQVLTMDMLLTFCTTLALAGVWLAFRQRDRRWYSLAYPAVGFGILAKGPVAFILVGVPALILLLRHARGRERYRALDPAGILLAVAVVLPWYVAVESDNPGFLSSFLFHHHLQRFFAPWHHQEPFWFYGYVLPVALFPLGLLWLLDLRRIRLPPPRTWSPQTTLLLSWAVTTILVFSASRSKLIPYVLPALPPLAILLARLYVSAWSGDSTESTRLVRRTSIALAAIGVSVGVVATVLPMFGDQPRIPLLTPYLGAASIVLISTAVLTRCCLRFGPPALAFSTIVAGAFGLLLVVTNGRALSPDYAHIGAAAAARPAAELLVYGRYLPGLGFYTRRRVTVLGEGDAEKLGELWSSASPVLLVTSPEALTTLADIVGTDPTVLAEQNRRVLVTQNRRVSARPTVRNRRGP